MNVSTASKLDNGPVAPRTPEELAKALKDSAAKNKAKRTEAKAKPITPKSEATVTATAKAPTKAKAKAPKAKAASKPKAKAKAKDERSKARVVGLRGERPFVVGAELKSRMIRVDAAFADMLTKKAKDDGVSITALTRKMVK